VALFIRRGEMQTVYTHTHTYMTNTEALREHQRMHVSYK